MEKDQDRERPYTLTPEYDRSKCGDCRCAFCYSQEFCDRCSTCEEQSRYKKSCSRFEGAFNY